MRPTLKERLLKGYEEDQTTGCWNWIKYRDRDGYGNIAVKSKPMQAHRASYQVFVGPLEPSLFICHTCDNPSCINPDHLYQGTHKQNQKDKQNRQRIVGEKHPYAKLKDTDILKIRNSDLSQEKLGKIYNVTQAHVGRIKRNLNWSHI